VIHRIQLNRPELKNALTTQDLIHIKSQLIESIQNPDIHLIVIESKDPSYFCAGGDVKSLYTAIQQKDSQKIHDFFFHEYSCDYLVHICPKPLLSWVDGIQFGGGLGLCRGAKYKVMGSHTLISMPEVLIGLFPDVGATYFLNQCSEEIKWDMALKARRLSGQEILQNKFADYHIPIENKDEVLAMLNSKDKNVSSILSEHHQNPPSSLPHNFEENVKYASPSSVSFTTQALQKAKSMSLRQCFETEFQYAIRFCENSDFAEGVRALLVDKDKKPKWQHHNLDSFFEPIEAQDFKSELDRMEKITNEYPL